jgi:formylmethanofuran dehydrogenase subunit E
MERADAERRAMLAARAREEQEERRRAAAGAAAANVIWYTTLYPSLSSRSARPLFCGHIFELKLILACSCSSCNSELKPEQVVNVKGTNYCYRCSLAASADRCAGCNKPILSGTMLKAGAKKFHPDCLKCEKCQAQLTDGYRVRRNKMLCIPCSQTSL